MKANTKRVTVDVDDVRLKSLWDIKTGERIIYDQGEVFLEGVQVTPLMACGVAKADIPAGAILRPAGLGLFE